MMHCRLCALIISVSAAVLPAAASLLANAQDATPVVIRNVRVFDGVRVLSDTAVLVRNGRIAEIGSQVKGPSNATVIDAAGQTLLPGLIDSHVHLAGDVTALNKALLFGVTTVLEMFAVSPERANSIKREQALGKNTDRADLLSAGIGVTAPGGHGTQFGVDIPTVSHPEEAQAFIDARIGEGSDYIKIIYGPQRSSGGAVISPETLAASIRAAHTRNKLAVVHIHELKRAREAIALGADGLVHAPVDQKPDVAFSRIFKERGAFLIPTLTLGERIDRGPIGAALTTDPRLTPFLTEADVKSLTQAIPPAVQLPAGFSNAHAVTTVRLLAAAQVPILAGSDAPNPGTAHGISLHRELELLVGAGLTPLAALAAATSEPAKRFGLSDRGHITVGARADLLLVSGDPTTTITATRNIVAVWKHGVPLDRERAAATLKKPGVASLGLPRVATPGTPLPF